MLLSLLFYGYATGVFRSRKIATATYDQVAFRFLAGHTHPDHATLASFRVTFLDLLPDLFTQLLPLTLVAIYLLLHLPPGRPRRLALTAYLSVSAVHAVG